MGQRCVGIAEVPGPRETVGNKNDSPLLLRG